MLTVDGQLTPLTMTERIGVSIRARHGEAILAALMPFQLAWAPIALEVLGVHV